MSNLESHHYYKPFTSNIAGFIIPMTTGLLSACSSGLIIYIISRSQQKLSTTYHRIMTLMSIFDIISSLFIALGTIMMPSDTIYKLAGPMLGNKVTCKIQGWFIAFGLAGSTSSNACLTWYFVCRIVFKMEYIRMKQRIEPFMYLYALFFACYVPSFHLSQELLNPNPYDSFCTVVPYPESCDTEKWYDWNKCIWSESAEKDLLNYKRVPTAVIGLQCALMVIGMSIIVWNVHKTNQKMKSPSASHDSNQESHNLEEENGVQEMKYARVIKLQALLYLLAFFFTWVLTFFSGSFDISNYELDAINCILFPLQGFWNLLIFLYDKTYLIRQSDTNRINFINAAKQIVGSPSKVPSVVFSNLSKMENPINEEDNSYKKSGESNDSDTERKDRESSDALECFNEPSATNISLSDRASSMSFQNQSVDKSNSSYISTSNNLSMEEKASNPNIFPFHEIRGVQFLGNDNKRFFQNDNGIRRTGEMKDNRLGRVALNSTAVSIESPAGFVGDSVDLSHDDHQSW